LIFYRNTEGTPTPGSDFYNTVLSIFESEHPFDELQKLGLLGHVLLRDYCVTLAGLQSKQKNINALM
jgi:hypothetical protein